jgi:hypothetical protein
MYRYIPAVIFKGETLPGLFIDPQSLQPSQSPPPLTHPHPARYEAGQWHGPSLARIHWHAFTGTYSLARMRHIHGTKPVNGHGQSSKRSQSTTVLSTYERSAKQTLTVYNGLANIRSWSMVMVNQANAHGRSSERSRSTTVNHANAHGQWSVCGQSARGPMAHVGL